MDILGLVCNLAFALGLMFLASKKFFQNVELKYLLAFVVAAYLVMPIPTIGVGVSLIVLVTCLVKWGDATGIEAVAYSVVSLIIATVLGDLTAYIIQYGELPPSPAEYFSSASL
jgi:hypothetical protein